MLQVLCSMYRPVSALVEIICCKRHGLADEVHPIPDRAQIRPSMWASSVPTMKNSRLSLSWRTGALDAGTVCDRRKRGSSLPRRLLDPRGRDHSPDELSCLPPAVLCTPNHPLAHYRVPQAGGRIKTLPPHRAKKVTVWGLGKRANIFEASPAWPWADEPGSDESLPGRRMVRGPITLPAIPASQSCC